MSVRHIPAILALVAGSLTLKAAELKPETLESWNGYVRVANAHMKERADGAAPFLWTDESVHRLRRVRSGEVVVERAHGEEAQKVPHGLIHDWIGAAFVPNATVANVLAVVRDYDRYQEVFGPTVASVHLTASTPRQDRFSMVWLRKVLFVTAAVDSDYESRYIQVDEKRWYSSASSTRVQQIRNYGRPDEQMLPCDQGDGFLWRLHSISRFAERDGGVYVEVQAIGLSRDIPFSMEWMVRPVIERLSRDSILATLQGTRGAIEQKTFAARASSNGQ